MKTEELAPIRLPARFQIVRELGRGGMGVVYEVDDQQLGIHVALKTLTRTTAQYLLRLKSEFRTLANLSHSNLACLYELMEFEGQWFFTMELIGGVPFPEWVRGSKVSTASQELAPTTTSTSVSNDDSWMRGFTRSPVLSDAESFERLRTATMQLASALDWMHGRGVLHRDIKGSNVLVTPEGRVVLLDFGLALQMSGKSTQGYAGTPAYMAPERFRNAVPVPAEDWYSFGAMLFETIAGQHASSGIRTRETRVPSLRSLVPHAPEDIASLTDDLLQPDPVIRPSGAEILTRLLGPAALADSLPKAPGHSVFARQEELDTVRSAFARVSDGRAVAAVVHGASGMGKSSLAEELFSSLPDDCLVLRGRCFEQESVPYKAFDGIIDNLADELGRMRPEEVAAVLPRDPRALAVLFPILLEVTEFGQSPKRAHVGLTPFDVKRRGTEALREMLQRLGDRRNVILYADDFQWADADSRQLLTNLLSPPSPPAVMVLMTCRDEEGAHDSLSTFLEGIKGSSDELEVVDVSLARSRRNAVSI